MDNKITLDFLSKARYTGDLHPELSEAVCLDNRGAVVTSDGFRMHFVRNLLNSGVSSFKRVKKFNNALQKLNGEPKAKIMINAQFLYDVISFMIDEDGQSNPIIIEVHDKQIVIAGSLSDGTQACACIAKMEGGRGYWKPEAQTLEVKFDVPALEFSAVAP